MKCHRTSGKRAVLALELLNAVLAEVEDAGVQRTFDLVNTDVLGDSDDGDIFVPSVRRSPRRPRPGV